MGAPRGASVKPAAEWFCSAAGPPGLSLIAAELWKPRAARLWLAVRTIQE